MYSQAVFLYYYFCILLVCLRLGDCLCPSPAKVTYCVESSDQQPRQQQMSCQMLNLEVLRPPKFGTGTKQT